MGPIAGGHNLCLIPFVINKYKIMLDEASYTFKFNHVSALGGDIILGNLADGHKIIMGN